MQTQEGLPGMAPSQVCLSGRHRSVVPTVLRGMNKQLEQCLTEAVFELVQGSPQLPA